MSFITDKITYNVRERGRKARGVDRNFDTAALAALINGPAVQEKVNHGDMLGYYGHWPRLKLGMEPQEGGIVDGAVVSVAPALRTVELSAQPDGTIIHRAEFLDTEPGQIAQRLYQSKAGGFSSAIETVPRTTPAIPKGFFGFDFVNEPNYTTNRGHRIALDGVSADDLADVLDSALAYAGAGEAEMMVLFDALQQQHADMLHTMQRVLRENEQLIARLASSGRVLDSALALEDAGRSRIVLSTPGSVDDLRAFRDMPLAALDTSRDDDNANTLRTSDEGVAAMRRYGFGRR